MRRRQHQAQRVDDDPEQVDDVVPVRGHDERARRVGRLALHIVGQGARYERRPQVDGYGREPDHWDAEQDAVRRVQKLRPQVQLAVWVILLICYY